MIKSAILLALVATVTAAPSVHSSGRMSPTSRIIGGTATTIEQIPYQVSIAAWGIHTCGGVIISADWVLTAAKCIIFPTGWYTIRAGSTFSNSGGSIHTFSTVIRHENFQHNSFHVPLNDIAVVRVNTPFQFDSSRAAINLYNAGEEIFSGSPALVSGWGVLHHGGHKPDNLQAIIIPIVSRTACNIVYERLGGLPEGQICAGLPEGGMDACEADFGGPLTISGRLAGISSWTHGCGRPGFPGVYTEISSHRVWITQNTGI